MEKKYIITSGNLPIIFSEGQKHSDFKMFDPISAGFVKFNVFITDDLEPKISAECYGESESLGLKSRPNEDETLINKLILS